MATLVLATIVLYVLFVLWRDSTAATQAPAARTVNVSAGAPAPGVEAHRHRTQGASSGGIKFIGAGLTSGAAPRSLDGVCDPLTGRALADGSQVYGCGRCSLVYGAASYVLLRQENGGRCIGCGTTALGPVASPGPRPSARVRWQEVTPTGAPAEAVATIDTYRSREGQVIVFEGRCVRVLAGRRGHTFALMFERGTWAAGFKAVVFPEAVQRLGGPGAVNAFQGHWLRIRGRVQRHPRWGWEIVIADPSMLQRVS